MSTESEPTIGFKKLVQEMIGKDTLNGWDMVVSYNESKLNELLQKRAESMKGHSDIDPFPIKIQSNPFDPNSVNEYMVELKLSHPKMRFTEGTDAALELTFQLSGKFTDEKTKVSRDLEPGLMLKTSSSLVVVQGTTSGGLEDLTPTPDKKPLSAKQVSLLEPGTVHGVCIDLRGAKVDIVQDETGGKEKIDPALLDSYTVHLGPYIALEFKHSLGLRYLIAGMNTTQPDTSINLRPTSFCFSSVGGKSPALLMWIGVSGGRDDGNPGSASVSFHPESFDRSPIPEESSSSVVLSHDLMASHFIKGMVFELKCPPMKTSNNENVLKVPAYDQNSRHVDGVDIDVSATSAKLVLRSPNEVRGSGVPIQSYEEDFEKNALEVLFKDDRLQNGNHKSKDAILTWISPKQTLKWKYTGWTKGAHPTIKEDEGTDYLDCSFASSGVWSLGATNSNQLTISWETDKSFYTHIKPTKETSFLDWINLKHPGDIPQQYKDFQPTLPEKFKMDFRPLNYFLATNLLFPGSQTFISDDPGKTTAAKGLAVPRDTILTGSIVSQLPTFGLSQELTLPEGSLSPVTVNLASNTADISSDESAPKDGEIIPSEEAIKFVNAFGDFSSDDPLYRKLFQAAVIDTFETREAAFEKAFRDHGLSIEADDLVKLFGWNRERLMNVLKERIAKDTDNSQFETKETPSVIDLEHSSTELVDDTSKARILESKANTELTTDLMKPWATVYETDTTPKQQFVVFPDTGYFGFPYKRNSSERIIPTVLSSNQAEWTSGGNTYTITFSSDPDVKSMTFRFSFTCKVTSSTGISSFNGTQRKADSAINDMNTSITVMGLGFGLFGIVMAVLTCKWRRDDMKQKRLEEQQETQKMNDICTEALRKDREARNKSAEERCLREMKAEVTWPGDNYHTIMEKAIQDRIEASANQWKGSVGEIGHKLTMNQENTTIKNIQESVMSTLKSEIIQKVAAERLLVWQQKYMFYELDHMFEAGKIGKLAEECIEKELIAKIEAKHDGSSWFEDRFRESFANALKVEAKVNAGLFKDEAASIGVDMGLNENYGKWDEAMKLRKELEVLKEKQGQLAEKELKKFEEANDIIEENQELNDKEAKLREAENNAALREELSKKLESESKAAKEKADKKQEKEMIFKKHHK
ncbi:hypothetical protein Forpe1208_v000090 [Fusarium oxysporum f. sp. rapae]|uniref:Uncharacterized protein n=1 Tax=Fusarium oxysporum f. sp. rapae TaxID=485398 RepID=A0A8J5PD92_FUSOX|nr:hypothetical protein Forpe1208_v000090 [Fusarium oxysporum f. sp. rapae]